MFRLSIGDCTLHPPTSAQMQIHQDKHNYPSTWDIFIYLFSCQNCLHLLQVLSHCQLKIVQLQQTTCVLMLLQNLHKYTRISNTHTQLLVHMLYEYLICWSDLRGPQFQNVKLKIAKKMLSFHRSMTEWSQSNALSNWVPCDHCAGTLFRKLQTVFVCQVDQKKRLFWNFFVKLFPCDRIERLKTFHLGSHRRVLYNDWQSAVLPGFVKGSG